MSNIHYRTDGTFSYKIITTSKKIYKVTPDDVEMIDYDSNYESVINFKPLKKNDWNSVQNKFFISRHFEWIYEGVCYITTDKDIKYETPVGGYSAIALVFHNGMIWEACYSGNYYPRMWMKAKIKRTDKETGEVKIIETSKWTDAKFLRAFEKAPEAKQRAMKLKEIFNDCFDL
jgi:hypothetical protein